MNIPFRSKVLSVSYQKSWSRHLRHPGKFFSCVSQHAAAAGGLRPGERARKTRIAGAFVENGATATTTMITVRDGRQSTCRSREWCCRQGKSSSTFGPSHQDSLTRRRSETFTSFVFFKKSLNNAEAGCSRSIFIIDNFACPVTPPVLCFLFKNKNRSSLSI